MSNSQVSGVVEAVGTKFSGSLKVNGEWHNMKKGTKYDHVKPGDIVLLEKKSWDFEGKTGSSVVSVGLSEANKAVSVPKNEPETASEETPKKEYKARDFDKEAEGKCRHGLFCAALQSPSLAQFAGGSVEDFLSVVEKVADYGMGYVFKK